MLGVVGVITWVGGLSGGVHVEYRAYQVVNSLYSFMSKESISDRFLVFYISSYRQCNRAVPKPVRYRPDHSIVPNTGNYEKK